MQDLSGDMYGLHVLLDHLIHFVSFDMISFIESAI